MKMFFVNVNAPVLSIERKRFLNVLCDVIHNCTDDFLFLGGFTCTENAKLDGNYLESHPASSVRLKRLIET